MRIEAPIPFDAIPLLAALRPDDRAELEPLCRVGGYAKGDVLFREGQPAERINFVHYGGVKLVKAAGPRDAILEIVGPGEPVCAVAAFERNAFPASAITLEATGIVSIAERDFFALLERRPEMMRHVLAGLTERLLMVNQRLADLTGSAEQRAARLFLTLCGRVGLRTPDGVRIPLALSRQEIADLTGTTLATAIRLMSRWQKEAIVLTEIDGFLVPDPAALAGANR